MVIAIILSKIYVLLIYEAVYYLSFEYLNSNAKYREIRAHKTYNWLFIGYLAFEVLVRAHLLELNEAIDYHINSVEHLFFTFLISMTISIYLHFFNLMAGNRFLKLMVVFVILNGIGIVNEYFQNWYQELPIFYLEETDLKDLVINFIGSSLFVVISMFYKNEALLAQEVKS
jgi:hypothetical protein